MNQSVENLLHARDAFLRLSRCKPADTVAVYGKEVYTEVWCPVLSMHQDVSRLALVHAGPSTGMRCEPVGHSEFLRYRELKSTCVDMGILALVSSNRKVSSDLEFHSAICYWTFTNNLFNCICAYFQLCLITVN